MDVGYESQSNVVVRLHLEELLLVEEVAERLALRPVDVRACLILRDVKELDPREIERRRRDREEIAPYSDLIRSLHNEDLIPVKQISQKVGVSWRRVESFLRNEGSFKSEVELRRLRERREAELHRDGIRDSLLRTRNRDATAMELGLSPTLVQIVINTGVIPEVEVLLRFPRNAQKIYSKDELLDGLRLAAVESDRPLTTNAYDRYVSSHPDLRDGRRTPGKQTVINRFGGWGAALRLAGLPANPSGGPKKKFDSSDVLLAITTCWKEIGHAPTVQEYDQWQVGKARWPSSATARKLIDEGWPGLQLRSWQIVYGTLLDQDDAETMVPKELLDTSEDVALRGAEYLAQYSYVGQTPEFAPGALHSTEAYLLLERAVESHMRIQDSVARLGERLGLAPQSPTSNSPLFDVALSTSPTSLLLIEVKSATALNLELQMRIAVGQVLRYASQMRAIGFTVEPCVAIELEPDASWRELLSELGIGLLVETTLESDLLEVASARGLAVAPIDADIAP